MTAPLAAALAECGALAVRVRQLEIDLESTRRQLGLAVEKVQQIQAVDAKQTEG